LLRPRPLRTGRATFIAPGSSRPVKIRCRKRRTSSSARRQSTWCQSRGSSSGPFTTAMPWCPTCPSVLVSLVIISPQAHLTRVSTLSGSGMRPCPASYAGRPAERPAITSRFPVAFRPPAFASRVILFPLGGWAFLAVGLPVSVARGRTPSGFHVPHARVATGLGALSTPRTAVLSRLAQNLQPPPAASQRQCPYTPVLLPSPEAQRNEASSRVHLRSPVRSSPCL
jgi:hypothetical protein